MLVFFPHVHSAISILKTTLLIKFIFEKLFLNLLILKFSNYLFCLKACLVITGFLKIFENIQFGSRSGPNFIRSFSGE